jgi:hypothetical protein
MEGRQLLQCLERVRKADQPGVVALGILVHDGVGSAGLEGLDGIGVAVERLALRATKIYPAGGYGYRCSRLWRRGTDRIVR